MSAPIRILTFPTLIQCDVCVFKQKYINFQKMRCAVWKFPLYWKRNRCINRPCSQHINIHTLLKWLLSDGSCWRLKTASAYVTMPCLILSSNASSLGLPNRCDPCAPFLRLPPLPPVMVLSILPFERISACGKRASLLFSLALPGTCGEQNAPSLCPILRLPLLLTLIEMALIGYERPPACCERTCPSLCFIWPSKLRNTVSGFLSFSLHVRN